MVEIWKDIQGYEGLYQISTLGRLKTLSREIVGYGIHDKVTLKEYIRKIPKLPLVGYRRYNLRKHGTSRAFCAHKLVAIAFLINEDPTNKTQVNHIDGDMGNDSIDNLEWVTPSENQLHAYATGLRERFTQANHPKSKKVKNILSGEVYNSIKELSEKIGVNHSTLRCQLNGIRKNKTNYIII